MSVNLLFTSVGRRVELLSAFRAAYEGLGIEGRIVGLDADPLAPALSMADRPYIVPRLDDSEFLPALQVILKRENITAVFPLIDPDVPMLARHRTVLEAGGCRLAVAPEPAAAVAGDKWATAEFFRRQRIPAPRSWLPGQLDPATADYPLFVKPRRGSASQNTFRVDDARQLGFFADYVPDAIIQEYLPGAEITNDVVCDFEGRVLSVVSRERIRVRAGEVLVGRTIFDRRITDACVTVARTLPAIGPITVQCMMKDGRPYFTEINARLGGGVPLGVAAGADIPRWLLAAAAGLPIDAPPLGSYQRGVYLYRFDQSQFLTEAQREQMASRHI